jgi:hypothetical protein
MRRRYALKNVVQEKRLGYGIQCGKKRDSDAAEFVEHVLVRGQRQTFAALLLASSNS